MADLLVLGFRAEATAQVALDAIDLLDHEDYVDLDDLALITRREDGRLDVRRARNRTASGAGTGVVAGVVAGAVESVPAHGAHGTAPAGADLGEAGRLGVDARMAAAIAERLPPGAGHVLLMLKRADETKMVERIGPYEPELVATTLPGDRARTLQAEFSGPSSGR